MQTERRHAMSRGALCAIPMRRRHDLNGRLTAPGAGSTRPGHQPRRSTVPAEPAQIGWTAGDRPCP